MAYNLKYLAEYDTNSGIRCRVEIYKRNYEGIVYPLELAAEPVTQTYDIDEAKPAIKACNLKLNIINSGSTPITDFYSERDDEFKIMHYYNGAVTFVGFLVQDDCSEEMSDYRHLLALSFTDNLGLLKDVRLDENVPDFGYYPAAAKLNQVFISTNRLFLYNTDFIPAASGAVEISGHVDNDVNTTFTLTSATNIGNGNYRCVVGVSVSDTVAFPVKIAGPGTINLYRRNTITNFLRVILHSTGLDLVTNIYCNVFEDYHETTYSPLYQTYIDGRTFINNDTFRTCWDVLEWICDRFNLTIFQANGQWQIVRQDEWRYGNLSGFSYSPEFDQIGTANVSTSLLFGFEQQQYPETAPTKSIVRPFKYVQEKFDYRQPAYLLRNYDLQELGPLIQEYTTGSGPTLQTIKEYVSEFIFWGGIGTQPEVFIRVVFDSEDNEIERYLVIKGVTGDNPRSAVGLPFEVSAGDKIKVQYTFDTNASQAGPGTIVLAVLLTDGTNDRYADEDKTVNWKVGVGWNYLVPTGANTQNDQAVTIDPGQIPFDGLIYIYFPQAVNSAGANDETRIKDIRVTYTAYINDSTKVIGHTHTETQDAFVKNNEAGEINVDDGPRNSIAGIMYRADFTGNVQQRTAEWYRITNDTERLKLGAITTLESLFARRRPRAKIEGRFYGLNNLSLLTKANYVPYTTLNFIFGRLEINYRSNSFDCTLYELFEQGENDTLLNSDYQFTYLYSAD